MPNKQIRVLDLDLAEVRTYLRGLSAMTAEASVSPDPRVVSTRRSVRRMV